MLIMSFDLETGGLKAGEVGITEIAACFGHAREDGTFSELKSVRWFIKPDDRLRYEEKALEIQGITLDHLHEHGVPFAQARQELEALVIKAFGRPQDANSWAHNAGFDVDHLKAVCALDGLWCPVPFTTCCTMHIFRGVKMAQQLPTKGRTRANLADACAVMGIPFDEEQAHGALYDCQRTAHLAAALLGRISHKESTHAA